MTDKEKEKFEDELLDKSVRDIIKEVYSKAENLHNKYGTYIQIGIYYNKPIEKQNIVNWLKIMKPFNLYKFGGTQYERFENKDRDIQIKILRAHDVSRGEKNHVVLYSKDIDRKIVWNIIEPSIIGYISPSVERFECIDDLDPTWKFINTY